MYLCSFRPPFITNAGVEAQQVYRSIMIAKIRVIVATNINNFPVTWDKS